MKKFLILTSAIALAACGGGNGGGGSTVAPRAATLIGQNLDNNEITSMASAVVVKNDGSYSDIARTAHAPDKTSYAGYTIYKLDNVDFKLAETDDATFNFEIDNSGRITKVIGNRQEIERDETETDAFHGKIFQFSNAGNSEDLFTIIDDGTMTQTKLDAAKAAAVASGTITQEQANTGHWNYLEQKWKFNTGGKDKNLTYSDFGYFTATNIRKLRGVTIDSNGDISGEDNGSNHSSVMVFSGGYDILPEATRPEKGAEFRGTAIGMVHTHLNPQGNSYYTTTAYAGSNTNGDTAMLKTQNAYLTIDSNGKTVLEMPFGSDENAVTKDASTNADIQWYDVVVNDDKISFNTPTSATITPRFKVDVDTTDVNVTRFNEGYYGVTTPVEATGSVEYKYNDKDVHIGAYGAATRDFDFQAAYGLAKE